MLSNISNISFKSTPIYDVKVKKKGLLGYKNVDATILLYDPDDVNDIDAVRKTTKYYKQNSFVSDIFENFCTEGYDNTRLYVLELKGKKPIEKRILSLCECFYATKLKKCYVDLLQSVRGSTRSDRNKYKGAGEVILYGVVKEAKKEGIEKVELTSCSAARQFYRYIGFLPVKNTLDFTLPQRAYDRYIKKIEEKYGVE